MSSADTVYQALDLVAITSAALVGSTAARFRGLDAVGVLCCAFITGLGGGLLRDILQQDGVQASLANPWNPAAALAAGALLCFVSPRGVSWRVLARAAEAATTGSWAATGTEKAAPLGIAPVSAVTGATGYCRRWNNPVRQRRKLTDDFVTSSHRRATLRWRRPDRPHRAF